MKFSPVSIVVSIDELESVENMRRGRRKGKRGKRGSQSLLTRMWVIGICVSVFWIATDEAIASFKQNPKNEEWEQEQQQENKDSMLDEPNAFTMEEVKVNENIIASNDEVVEQSEGNESEDSIDQIVEETWVGVGPNGQSDTYDAAIISDKLMTYNYKNNGEKIAFLTFDDGTSTTVTPKILKILSKYGVKATFFLTGRNIENGGVTAKDLVKDIFEQGHAIGNHSYSHEYKTLYPGRELNLTNFLADFKKTDQLLQEIIGEGFSTRVIRCPGGFMSWKNMSQLREYMNENNMVSIDWNALSKDAEGVKKTASQLLYNVIETVEGKDIVVILMHDTYGKEETVKALPSIIEYLQTNGYEFKSLS